MDKSLPLLRCREKDRLTVRDRRDQLVRAAAAEFARTGLHAITKQALARAADISQPVLYMHFASKECLFREAIQWNRNARTHAVQRRIGSIAAVEIPEWLEQAVEAGLRCGYLGAGHLASHSARSSKTAAVNI